METQCPYCKQQYDVEDEALGQFVECPECNKSFQVESLQSASNKDEDVEKVEKKPFVSLKILTAVFVLIVLLVASSIGLWVYSQKPSKKHAIENRADIGVLIIMSKYQITNQDATKTLCTERAKLEFKAAKTMGIEEEYVSFWCDKDILSILLEIAERKDTIKTEEEIKKIEKQFQEILDVKHPQNKTILGLTDTIEKEFSPIDEIVLKHGYARSLFLIEQDKKYPAIDSSKLFSDLEKRLNVLLYNIYLKDNEIEYPDELKAFCSERAREMVSIIQKEEELAIDWAKIILSDEMKKEMETGLKEDGTTRNALFWLGSFGEKQIPPIPYGCSADYYLYPRDFISFRKDYNDIALYGKKRSKY